MANISNIVNVSIIPSGRTLSRTNMNIVAIMTTEKGFLNSFNRSSAYTDLNSVANDFGTFSKTYDFAKTLFSQTKNPTNSGGYLVVGYWRAQAEEVEAKSAIMKGAELSPAVVVSALQQLAGYDDIGLSINVDGVSTNGGQMSFSVIDSLEDVLDILNMNSSFAGITFSLKNNCFIVTTIDTGALKTIDFATFPGAGNFVDIASIIGLVDGSGATLTQGSDAITLPAETKEDAILALQELEPFRGCVFIDTPTKAEAISLANLAQSTDVIFYDVISGVQNLESDTQYLPWSLKLAELENYRLIYSKTNNRKLAVAMMSRMHTVNFNNENSAITLNLKAFVGIIPEDYTQNEINKCKRVGLELYTIFGDLGKFMTSGANGFTDNVYNFIAIKRFVQLDLFNLLGITGTKIPQTDVGVLKIVATIEKTLSDFRRALVISAGTWNSPDTFGDVDVFIKNIETVGYYVLAQPLFLQSQSDREQRKSPAIQVAFKNAGAIHTIDTTIQYNL